MSEVEFLTAGILLVAAVVVMRWYQRWRMENGVTSSSGDGFFGDSCDSDGGGDGGGD